MWYVRKFSDNWGNLLYYLFNFQELNKLRSALVGRDNNRFQDLAKMTGFHHTGDLECFNSLGNKYRAKGYVYG